MKTLQEDHASQSHGVLYDFVYLDRERLASLAAQLFEQGLLTGTKISSSRDSSDKLNFRVDAAVAKGGHEGITAIREGIERSFDASWSIPLDVIDQLRCNDMISDDLSVAAFGQLVLIEGTLSIYDIEMLKTMYRPFVELASQAARAPIDEQYQTLSASIDQAIASSTGQEKAKHKQMKTQLTALRRSFEDGQERQRKQADAIFDLVKLLPHALQATVEGRQASAWMTLSPQQMITSPDDFALKHGSAIPGIWSVIGTLDSRPTPPTPASKPNLKELLVEGAGGTPADDQSVGHADEGSLQDGTTPGETGAVTPQNLVQGMKQMQDGVRSQFGRPDNFYGITPLAIYRQMTAYEELSAVS